MIRYDGLDNTFFGVLLQLLPQGVLVGLRADGRAALVACVTLGYLLSGKRKIVRTSFGSDIHTLGPSFSENGDGFHSRQVYNV